MNTQTYMSQEVKLVYSDMAQQAIELGYARHYRFRVIGSGEVPKKSFYQGSWWFEPVNEPPFGKEILDYLKQSGVAYKGVVVAHEVSLVEVPTEKENKESDFKISSPSIPAQEITEILGKLVMGALFVIGFIATAIVSDPAVIIVLPDNTWLEVCNVY